MLRDSLARKGQEVLEDRLLDEFAQALRADAMERLTELPPEMHMAPAAALTEIMLGYLEEAGVVTEHELCPHQDDGGHRPCRLIGFSLPEDSTRLELFTCPDDLSAPTLSRRDLARLSGWAARFFEYAGKGDFKRFAQNGATLEAATHVNQELARIEEVRVNVLTSARASDREVADIAVLGRPISTEVWDIERLYRAAGEEVSRDRIEIDFVQLLGRPLSCLEMKPRPSEYETYLAILPGPLIYQLFDQFGARLFEFNVRSFLQAKGAVNKGIQRTLKESPGRFLAYNNGLTATADEIEVSNLHGETVIRKVRGLQIVNGAQTTSSIYRALKMDKVPLDDVAVSMKLTLVSPDRLDEFVPLIARFANTQNPIQVADLSASDRFHQQFESLSASVWPPGQESRWFYERARGSYQMARNREGSTPARRRDFDRTFPKSQYFGKTDLAKYLMTWWGMPHVVSRGAQKNYAAFMFSLRELFGEEWAPDKEFFRNAIGQAILFKAAQAVVRKARLQSYGANVVTYMMALLSERCGTSIDLGWIWDSQEASQELQKVFANWAPLIHAEIVESAGSRNVTEWCKKEDCWTEVRSLNLPLPEVLPPEFVSVDSVAAEVEHAVIDEEEQLVALCASLGAQTWARIVAWATSSPEVQDFDRKVAHTLSGYAMNGWVKMPSLKQALRGARVLSAARNAGVF